MDDPSLAAAVLDGDEAAQHEFYARFQERLHRTCVHFLGWQDPECEDLVQETFVLAFAGLRRYDPSRPLYPWLNKICVNLCFKRLKGRQRQVLAGDEALEAAAHAVAAQRHRDAEAKALKAEALELLRRAFARLSEGCRRIVGLRDYEGKSYVEIARTLKLAPGTVFSRLYRCREALRSLVLAKLDGGGRRG